MVSKIFSVAIVGLEANIVEVEADVSNGLPSTTIVGLAGTAVQESRERVKSAIKNSGLHYPLMRISVNLAPAHLPKLGTRYDLPIALGILAASKQVSLRGANKPLFIGELSLDGGVRGVTGVIATVMEAKQKGFTEVFVPVENWEEASLVKNIECYPLKNLGNLVAHFSGKRIQMPARAVAKIDKAMPATPDEVDFANIGGQSAAKRALEIAASGGHNIALCGPPGTGKTMLARALPGIMPELSQEEALEVANIYSVAGNWEREFSMRPFRAPHHTASYSTVIGGGAVARPGEITLAHRGVLFLDELPEFSRAVLESLRQPIEEGHIILTRAHYTVKFPSECLVVAAFNPCPCGYHNDGTARCNCQAKEIVRYQKKLSGPFLDRVDLKITVPRVEYKALNNSGGEETSEEVRRRVAGARRTQMARFQSSKRLNGSMSPKEIKKCCVLDKESQNLLALAADKYSLSGRGIFRIQKVARTIADLAGEQRISPAHIAESLHFRLGE